MGAGGELYDSLWAGLTDSLIKLPMGITAENLAKQYNITRQECDEYTILTQQRAGQADLGAEIAAIEFDLKKK